MIMTTNQGLTKSQCLTVLLVGVVLGATLTITTTPLLPLNHVVTATSIASLSKQALSFTSPGTARYFQRYSLELAADFVPAPTLPAVLSSQSSSILRPTCQRARPSLIEWYLSPPDGSATSSAIIDLSDATCGSPSTRLASMSQPLSPPSQSTAPVSPATEDVQRPFSHIDTTTGKLFMTGCPTATHAPRWSFQRLSNARDVESVGVDGGDYHHDSGDGRDAETMSSRAAVTAAVVARSHAYVRPFVLPRGRQHVFTTCVFPDNDRRFMLLLVPRRLPASTLAARQRRRLQLQHQRRRRCPQRRPRNETTTTPNTTMKMASQSQRHGTRTRTRRHFNVVHLLIDGLAHRHFRRLFPRTLHYLGLQHRAVLFGDGNGGESGAAAAKFYDNGYGRRRYASVDGATINDDPAHDADDIHIDDDDDDDDADADDNYNDRVDNGRSNDTHRQLRQRQFARSHIHVMEMTRLHVVGENSCPNKGAMFCGVGGHVGCYPEVCRVADDLIFSRFQSRGYVTAAIEPYSPSHTHFANAAIDHGVGGGVGGGGGGSGWRASRVFAQYKPWSVDLYVHNRRPGCVEGDWTHMRVLRYVRDVLTMYNERDDGDGDGDGEGDRDDNDSNDVLSTRHRRRRGRQQHPVFAQAQLMLAHSTNLLQAAPLDRALVTWLRAMRRDGRLRDTVVVLTSDHGIHASRHNDLLSSWLEHKNPTLFVLLPDAFVAALDRGSGGSESDATSTAANALSSSSSGRVAPSGVINTLRVNAHRLVTHMDVYHTLITAVAAANRRCHDDQHNGVDGKDSDDVDKAVDDASPIAVPVPVTYDLTTQVVPLSRTCRQARIPDKFCPCVVPK